MKSVSVSQVFFCVNRDRSIIEIRKVHGKIALVSGNKCRSITNQPESCFHAELDQ